MIQGYPEQRLAPVPGPPKSERAMDRKLTTGRLRIVVLTLGACLLVAACGSTTSVSKTSGVDQAARGMLPAAVRASGTLKIATSLEWPPFDYETSSGAPTGIDIKLEEAIAKLLGLRPVITNLAFPAIVPGVADGRFDIGADELEDLPSREQQVTFVNYYRAGLAVLVRKGTTGISNTNLCGVTLALTTGSSQITNANAISKQCVADGKPPIHEVFFPDSAVTILGVVDGRAQAFMTDNAVGLYTTETTDKSLKVLPGTIPGSTALSGIIVKKGNTGLIRAVQAALDELIKDGQYQAIMKAFGIGPANYVTHASIN